MKKRTKEEMTLYRRELRARKKLVTPIVTPSSIVIPKSLSHPVTPVKSVTPDSNVTPSIVTPITSCKVCLSTEALLSDLDDEIADLKKQVLERDLQIKKHLVRIAFLEKSMERYADIDTRVKNPKKFGGNWL